MSVARRVSFAVVVALCACADVEDSEALGTEVGSASTSEEGSSSQRGSSSQGESSGDDGEETDPETSSTSQGGTTTSDVDVPDDGASIFAATCGQCHGLEGVAVSAMAPDIAEIIPSYDDDGLADLFADGLTIMPPQNISQLDRAPLLGFLREEFGAYDPDATRDGQTLYEGLCSHCHREDGRGDEMFPDLYERLPGVDEEKLMQLITVDDFREEGRGLRPAEIPVFTDYLRARFGGQ